MSKDEKRALLVLLEEDDMISGGEVEVLEEAAELVPPTNAGGLVSVMAAESGLSCWYGRCLRARRGFSDLFWAISDGQFWWWSAPTMALDLWAVQDSETSK